MAEDGEDYGQLFRQHYREAFRLALLLTGGDRATAEDAVGDAFVSVQRHWEAGKVDHFLPYLRRAVANQVRRRQRRLRLQVRDEARQRGDQRGARAFEDDVGDQDAVWRALRTLPLKQRTAVALRFYHGLSLQEVAGTMNTSVGTAKAHVSRGVDRLRQLLRDEDDV